MDQEPVTTQDDEISLLDIAVVIAENWMMLVIVPFILGASTYLVLSMTVARPYRSEAILRIDATEAALLQSAMVLDPAMLGSDYLDGYSGSLSRARRMLIDNFLDVTSEPDTGFYRVGVTGETAENANNLLSEIVGSLVAHSAPNPARTALLELQRQEAQTALAALEATLARLNRIADGQEIGSGTGTTLLGNLGQSVVTIISEIEQRRMQLFRIEQSLMGTVSENDVVQPPTLPDSAGPRGIGMKAILVTLGSGFLLLILAFVRAGLKTASQDPHQVDKVNRIRRSFWLKPKKIEA